MTNDNEHLGLKSLNVLLWCDSYVVQGGAQTVNEHIHAFLQYSKHNIWLCDRLGDRLAYLDLSQFDVIVLHYSLYLPSHHYIGNRSKEKIRHFPGLKVAFVQDEYRKINAEIEALYDLKIDLLFTCFDEVEAEKIYSPARLPKLRKVNTLTGYVPESLLNESAPLIKDRNIDVGYRGRKLGFWYGELAYEKWDIVNKWNQHTFNDGLKTDISYEEKDRIYGPKWLEFIKQSKVQLGVESGASVMDFTGEIESIVASHMDKYPNDDFFKVKNLYFKDVDSLYKLNQISPRAFEAIALKTGLVLYEGEYSNILQPWRHYIPLKKDFSNIRKVLDCIKDNDFLQNMVDLTYNEIALASQYSYKNFIENFDRYINEEFILRKKIKMENYYNINQFKELVYQFTFKEKIRKILRFIYRNLALPILNKLCVQVNN